jgi:hypothetical protein
LNWSALFSFKEVGVTEKEFMDKYGKVRVRFRQYYKYRFTYEEEFWPNGLSHSPLILRVLSGGTVEEAYKTRVDRDEWLTVEEVCPNEGYVLKENGDIVAHFCEY